MPSPLIARCAINSYPAITTHLRSLSIRPFTTTSTKQIRLFFPETQTKKIRITPPAWPHPIYTEEDMKKVGIAHRETRTFSDRVALATIRMLRSGFDLVSGYRHDQAVALHKKDPATAQQKYAMTEEKYLIRNIFLESIAGVPGMVGGMLRHLRSLRRMKRDNGWIETLLEESYNERMHLLTFLQMAEPGLFLRLLVLGAQGVFFNAFFIAYLVNPVICHRFVGYLEEEAVITYTREIADIEAGKLPKWENLQAPEIAVKYWNMPEGHRSMRDLLLYIRADEAKHREVNHTFGNLEWKEDPNPYVSVYRDEEKPHPTKGIENLKPTGWERKDVV
ncbi:alternative oxidase [Aspergillus clavatus NRRL 1]|uniref:Alternative oxidase n=1 Tax=Aspergillus clavatus (strain ATCC 1007 / CBS 513.65 / DSM 816 / NCTC 3887 / NRRL 1 / QM 1276 / 107) TaxID=344612 RepID=A1CCD7_ASPCL|nr:alternative oxidase, putative [Aspergillus clavatus NRRL 1]EAW12194.1 alternative oxidase, putative [Aspergillus clavatus NRRL 1]